MEQLAINIITNSEERIKLTNINEDNKIFIFSYKDSYARIILRIEEIYYNIKCVYNGKLIGEVKIKKNNFKPSELSNIINNMINDHLITTNISKIYTYPINSNKTENYRKIVNGIARTMSDLRKELNILLFGVGNARFELDIIFTFYQNKRNRDTKLNLFFISQKSTPKIEEGIVKILMRISDNISPKFMYFMDIVRNISKFKFPPLDFFISLQMQHADFYNTENLGSNRIPTMKARKERINIKKQFYDKLFESLPIPFIFYRGVRNVLVNVFPSYLFEIMSVDMRLKLLNSDIYYNLIIETVEILQNKQLSNSSMTADPILDTILDYKFSIDNHKYMRYIKLLNKVL